ncbi:stalk domain-containing protein [Paenibacillus koleovorans]|uniref:stalk domain-containing protein n=1 Tax=Paenibacillus koleovorans TaxID=121608 RepID=UPI001FE622EF|nr:stalk domain-containing protein [Paenibacillus koleovorans]
MRKGKKPSRWQSGMIGFACGAVFFSGLSYAAGGATGIEVYFRELKYYFDGVRKEPPPEQQGFLYKDTTYVPLRFLTEALGKPVGWDDATSSIFVGERPVGLPTPTLAPTATPTPSPPANGGSPVGSTRLQVFPADNPWNMEISGLPVHPDSDKFIASIGLSTRLHADFGTVWDGAPNGIPYTVVGGDQPKVNIAFTDYGDESDPGPYPIPADAPIEGGPNGDGDRHVIVVDKDNLQLYELFNARPAANGGWEASSGARWDLTSNALRPKRWTSADAAGLPVFPGLVRYEEAAAGEINHALRFTVSKTQKGFIAPATHYASSSSDPILPPMGLRLRLKADFDISGYSPTNQAILRALQKYGMIVADNGSSLYLSGAPSPQWNDDDLRKLGALKGSDFEAVYTGPIER